MGQCVSRPEEPAFRAGDGIGATAKQFPAIAAVARLIQQVYQRANGACVLKSDCADFAAHVRSIEQIIVKAAPQLESNRDALAERISSLECTFVEAADFLTHFADRKYLAPRSLLVFLSPAGSQGGANPFAIRARSLATDVSTVMKGCRDGAGGEDADSASKELQWAAQRVDTDYRQSREVLALAGSAGGVGALMLDEDKVRRVEEVMKAPAWRCGPQGGFEDSVHGVVSVRVLVDDVNGLHVDTPAHAVLGAPNATTDASFPPPRRQRSRGGYSVDGAEGAHGRSQTVHGGSLYHQLVAGAARERHAAERSFSFSGAVLAGATRDTVTMTTTGTSLVWSPVRGPAGSPAPASQGGIMRLTASAAGDSVGGGVEPGSPPGRVPSRRDRELANVASLRDGIGGDASPTRSQHSAYGASSPSHYSSLPEGKGFSRDEWQALLAQGANPRTEDSASDICGRDKGAGAGAGAEGAPQPGRGSPGSSASSESRPTPPVTPPSSAPAVTRGPGPAASPAAAGRSPFYDRGRTGGGWGAAPPSRLPNGSSPSRMDAHQVDDLVYWDRSRGGGGGSFSGRLATRGGSSHDLRGDAGMLSPLGATQRQSRAWDDTSEQGSLWRSGSIDLGPPRSTGDRTPSRPGARRQGPRASHSLDTAAGARMSAPMTTSLRNLAALTPSRVAAHPLSSWGSVGSLSAGSAGSACSETSELSELDDREFGMSPHGRAPVVGDMARVMGTTASGDVWSPPPTRPKQGKRGQRARVSSRSHRKPTGGRSPVSASKSPAPSGEKPKAVHQISEDTTYMAWDMVPRAVDGPKGSDGSPGSDGTMEKCASDDDDISIGRPARGPALRTAKEDLDQASSPSTGLLGRLRRPGSTESLRDRLSFRKLRERRNSATDGSPPKESGEDDITQPPASAGFVSYSPDSSPERERGAGTFGGRKVATDWGY